MPQYRGLIERFVENGGEGEEFVNTLKDMLKRIKGTWSLSQEERDCVVSNAVVKFLRVLPDFEYSRESSAKSYLMTVLNRTFIDFVRHKKSEMTKQVNFSCLISADEDVSFEGTIPNDDLPVHEQKEIDDELERQRRLLKMALRKLNKNRRIAIEMELAGYTRKQGAKIMGITECSYNSFIFHGQRQLKAIITNEQLADQKIEDEGNERLRVKRE